MRPLTGHSSHLEAVNRAIATRMPVALTLKSSGGAGAAAVLVALVFITLSASLVGGKVFGSGDNIFQTPPFSAESHGTQVSNFLLTDPVTGFIPDLFLTRADLRSGTLPLWNPYAAAGRPLLASQQHAPLYPITWLAFLLPFWASLAWIAAAKILVAAGGTYVFCRELELRRGPSLLAAIAFGFGMYFIVWLEHPHTNVWALLPWTYFAARRVCARGSIPATALLALGVGLAWLGGHPESAVIVLAATAAYGAFELFGEQNRKRTPGSARRDQLARGAIDTVGGRAGLLVVGLVLGVGVGWIMIGPLLELLQQTGRTDRGTPGFPLRATLSLFFPELWGMPNKGIRAGPLNFNERTAYIGALPLLLAVGTIGRRRPREQWFFVALAVVLIATIYDTPVWSSEVRDFPEVNVFALGRLLIVVSFAGAVLAAYGLQRWLDGSVRERRQMLVIMGSGALIPPLIWLLLHLSSLSHLWSAIGQLPTAHVGERSAPVIALASVWRWVLISGLGLGVLTFVRKRRVAVALLIVLTAADLVTLDRGYHGSIPLSEANPPVPAAIRYLQAHQGNSRILASGFAFPANLAERYKLRDARVGVLVLYPRRYRQLWTTIRGMHGDQGFFNALAPGAHGLADLFAARYVLMPPGEPLPRWLAPVDRTAGGTVAINRSALPRAWVAYDWLQASGQTNSFALTVRRTTVQLHDRPVIEGAPLPPPGLAPTPTTAQITSDGSEDVTIKAVARHPGYLILDDSAYPGWTASLDGHAVTWYIANENFRAVALPAGHHLIAFHYRPASVKVGSIVTSTSLVLLLALAAIGWMRGRTGTRRDVRIEPKPRPKHKRLGFERRGEGE